MKIAILGGSFNPIHIGHAMLADTMIMEYQFDKVLFIPTNLPPHKKMQAEISTSHRLNMLKALCATNTKFECEDCEITRGGVSYTVDTLEYLHSKYPADTEFALLMGEEIACEFDKWKNSNRILQLATVYVVPRSQVLYDTHIDTAKNTPSGHYKGDFNAVFNKDTVNFPYRSLKSAMVSVSSTEIRSRILNGQSYKYLVPQEVFEYIEKNKLYR